jgi:hypothetical protein
MNANTEDRVPEAGSRTRWRFLPFAAGAFLALLTMETVVRQVYSISFAREPGFGYIRKSVLYRLEGDGLSRWTVHDLRRSAPPVPTKPSILVLGDSFTEALMVGDADVYTSLLERDLNASGLGVQVLNLGLSGTSAADYVAHAPLYRRLFSPLWTVVQLRTSDLTTDAWEAGKSHFKHGLGNQGLEVSHAKPHFEEVRENFWKQAVRAVPSMLGYYGVERLSNFAEGAAAETPLFQAGSADSPARGADPGLEEGYPMEEEMNLLARAYDGRVTCLFLPRFEPDRPMAPESSVARRFEEHCERRALSCVNLRKTYAAFTRRRRSPFGFSNTAFNAGHMNADGHDAAAAELMSEMGRLRSRGLF